MKKTLLIASVFAAFTVTAMAAPVPVTKIETGNSKVVADYAIHQRAGGESHHGFGVGLESAMTDKVAVQYGYNKVDLNNSSLKDHQLAGVYRVHNNVNLYGAGTYLDVGKDNGFGYQAGVIGHKQLTDKINGFAKVGLGNDIKHTLQVGGSYALRPDIDLNVYYQKDRYEIDNTRKNVNGIHAGVGYSF